jgi:long-chain acyl-CoA synthetase
MSPRAKNTTLVSLFADRMHAGGEKTALHIKRHGKFVRLTWNELADDALRTAAALLSLGVQRGDRIVHLSENRVEWIVMDLAIQLAQGVHVPMHAPLTGPQVVVQVVDSGARVVIVSGDEQAQKLAPLADRLPQGVHYISFDRCASPIGQTPIRTLAELTEDVAKQDRGDIVQRAVSSIGPESLATILYTSGTTGEPKGVMLSHRNLVSNALGTIDAFGMSVDDLKLCFLPLSHIYARTCDLYTWLAQGAQLALAESRDTVLADCALIKPTMINGVPYFYQRVHRYLVERGWANEPGRLCQLLGGRIRVCCSGGAALPDYLFDYFQQQGVPLLQGYGLTESSPVISLSSLQACKRGTVGRPIAGIEVRIASDGEILTRGPHVMMGFWQNPAATQEVIRDGWLYTGDIGQLDEDGFLKITGRKKELIVTAGGKNIAPTYLESLLCQDPLIEQAVVIGDARNYLTALIVPNADNLRSEIAARAIPVSTPADALRHPDVIALYEQRVARQLADVSHYEQIRKFTLLDRAFSVQRGELTPKLSLRRQVIEANFADAIEAMYRKHEPGSA